jgi:hypothetical protein
VLCRGNVCISWHLCPNISSNYVVCFVNWCQYSFDFLLSVSFHRCSIFTHVLRGVDPTVGHDRDSAASSSWLYVAELVVAQLVKQFLAVHGTLKFFTVLIRARRWSLSWANWIQSTSPHTYTPSFISAFIILRFTQQTVPELLLSCTCFLRPGWCVLSSLSVADSSP